MGAVAVETAEYLDSRQFYADTRWIGSGLQPKGPNFCVLNVMRVIDEDPFRLLFLKEYQRSGELVIDPALVEASRERLQLIGCRSHQSRFNFSFLCLKQGDVLSETGAERVELGRTYNVILDGKLHIPQFEAVLGEQSFTLLQQCGLIPTGKYVARERHKVTLTGLPLVPLMWANPSTLGLVRLLKEEKELMAEQTVLNAAKGELPPKETDIYSGKGEKSEKPVERYPAPFCEIRLMKYKPQSYNVVGMTPEKITSRLDYVKARLRRIRFVVRLITFAMEQAHSQSIVWGEEKTAQRGEWPKTEQTAVYDGVILKRVTWMEMVARS